MKTHETATHLHISSQMPWWMAGALFLLLGLSILAFRAFARGKLAHFLANRLMVRLGLCFSAGILAVGFLGALYAIKGLIYYTTLTDEGIWQHAWRTRPQHEVWKDLVSVNRIERRTFQIADGNATKDKVQVGLALGFMENGRWSVTIHLIKDDFSDRDWDALMKWLLTQHGQR
jgi:hypothetical protein